jgi:hypothetical protein
MAVDLGRAEVAWDGQDRTAPGPPIWERPGRPFWVRLLNGVGWALGRAGRRWPTLDPEAMLAEARRRAKLADFGDDLFRSGLAKLVASFDAQEHSHPFGRFFFREYCINLLVNRLKIQDDLNRYPQILEQPVRRPLFVVGLPRTGTTLLHRLLSEDPSGRTLLFWEALEPSPPPTPETRPTDPRIARAKRSLAMINSLAPRLAAAHVFAAEEPEEDNNLFANVFRAGINGIMFDVPGYTEWLGEQDLVPSYRYARRQLQLLGWKMPGDHWVLKSPAHLFGLDALLAVFPDACVVQTHRDPLESIPSLCSLTAAFRAITCDRVDLRRLGWELSMAMAEGVERALAVRASADPARFFDVPYRALLSDPVGVAREIARHFGYPHDAGIEARQRRWIAENPQHKHGVHRYSLDQFGLDPEFVRTLFADYADWMAANLRRAA